MSLFSTMNTSASGLGNSSANLGIIGDNIANINTTGYKKNRGDFADFLPQTVFGMAGPSQLGTGANLNQIAAIFAQGSIDQSENALDMAISGDGFFVVRDGINNYYSRAGAFFVDDAGYIVNAQGLNLQGYGADQGTLGATVQDLQVDLNPLAPAATTEIQMNALLSAEADFTTTPLTSGTLDIVTGTGDTLEDAANAADFATSVTVYDSLGQAHEVTILYERTGTNDYNWFAVVDAGELDAPAGTYTAGDAFTIASGSTTFDTAGDLTAFTQTNTSAATAWNFVGAAAGDYVFDFGVDTAGNATDGQVRLLSGESAVSAISQDGYPPGDLISLSVDTEGVITGQFSNGQDIEMGRVVLARFPSNAGLERVGNTLFRETLASGQPAIGQPDTGGRGKVIGNALEKSNVDLEDEFVNMITSQRTYQANARMIGTANDTLQELVQLV